MSPECWQLHWSEALSECKRSRHGAKNAMASEIPLTGNVISMGTKQTIGFGGGMIIGILVGALIDNMALGIILGCLLGFGILQIPGKSN